MTAESPPTTAGDNDTWMLLERQSADNWPLVVRSRCNAEVLSFSEINRVVAVICDVRADLVKENGMPACFDDLIAIEDALIGGVTACAGRGFHTASVTGDGRRVIYFAIEPTFSMDPILASVRTSIGELSLKSDFDFETYAAFITPTELDRQLDGDRSVIASLESKGDMGSSPRLIEFWFYGGRSSLESIVDRLSPSGFNLARWLDDDEGVVLGLESAADISTFYELTPLLIDTAAEFGATYDGWETFVVSPETTPPLAKPSLFGKLFGQRKH